MGYHLIEGAGQGADGKWPAEKSYLVLGMSRDQAEAAGRRYGQNAVVWADRDAIPLLALLR